FAARGLSGYAERRDLPGAPSTSLLSPHLAHGEISPFRIHAAIEAATADPADKAKFLSELGWREFSWHLLFHFPQLASRNFNPAFDAFPWHEDRGALAAWTRGRTGFPLVDAGMRQLWTTGWMHNRVRMVAASFLAKHLLIDWRHGEAWFWETLVDADPASNAASWQWVAGSGADAAPYFRIFNPATQAKKFDPDGAYARRHLTDPPTTPIVAHDVARARALAAFETMRRGAT
ncbi:MAG: deoxyribodipyrimidine photo-lyase, partial [Rhizobiaceae bacterium]